MKYLFAVSQDRVLEAFEARDLREAKKYVVSRVTRLRPELLEGWTGEWDPETGYGPEKTATLTVRDRYGRRALCIALSLTKGQPEAEPGPMDTHIAADSLLENLLHLREKLN